MDVSRCRLGSLKRSGIEGLEWTLELDVEYVGCKSTRNFDLHLSSAGSLPQPQQWTSVGKFLGWTACGGTEGSRFWPKALGLDLAYQEWFYDSKTVVGNLNPTVNGTYHAFVHLGTFSFRYLF
jgi:hypothetical protein